MKTLFTNAKNSVLLVLALIAVPILPGVAAVVVDFEEIAPGTWVGSVPNWSQFEGTQATVELGTLTYPAYGEHDNYLVIPASATAGRSDAAYSLAPVVPITSSATAVSFILSKEDAGLGAIYLSMLGSGFGDINYGKLSINGNGSIYQYDGSAWNQVAASGTIDWTGGTWYDFELSFDNTGAQILNVTAADSPSVVLVNSTFNRANAPTTISGWYLVGDTAADGGAYWHLDSVTVSAVPEPAVSTLAFLGVFGASVLLRSRSARRSVVVG